MHLFGFLSVSESEGILIYLDLGQVKKTLCSGFNELGLWAKSIKIFKARIKVHIKLRKVKDRKEIRIHIAC